MTRNDAYRAALAVQRETLDDAARTAWNEQLRRALHASARPVAAVREALAAGADPNARTPLGYTMLTTAILANRSSAIFVRCLLRAGANPHERDAHGNHPLAYAAKHGLVAVVTALLHAGCAVEQQTGPGETALEIALRHARPEVAVVLLAAGADLAAAARRNPCCLEVDVTVVAGIGQAVASGQIPSACLVPFFSARNPAVREAAFFTGTRTARGDLPVAPDYQGGTAAPTGRPRLPRTQHP